VFIRNEPISELVHWIDRWCTTESRRLERTQNKERSSLRFGYSGQVRDVETLIRAAHFC
jgi:hypothetical protein